jgi:hypothetical protein
MRRGIATYRLIGLCLPLAFIVAALVQARVFENRQDTPGGQEALRVQSAVLRVQKASRLWAEAARLQRHGYRDAARPRFREAYDLIATTVEDRHCPPYVQLLGLRLLTEVNNRLPELAADHPQRRVYAGRFLALALADRTRYRAINLAMAYAALDQPEQAEFYALVVAGCSKPYPFRVDGVYGATRDAFRRAGDLFEDGEYVFPLLHLEGQTGV